MSGITLSAGVRANLLALQQTSAQMATTQNRLATGLKVNSALDNPLNYFTAQSLNTRSNELSALLDSMSNGIQTIQAANNGLTSITSLVQQLASTVSQARSDSTAAPVTAGTATSGAPNANISNSGNSQLTFSLTGGNSVSISTVSTGQPISTYTGGSNVAGGSINQLSGSSITITSGNINGGNAITVSLVGVTTEAQAITAINSAINAADPTNGGHVWAQDAGGGNSKIVLTNDQGYSIAVADGATNSSGNTTALFGTPASASTTSGGALSASTIAASINANSTLSTQVKASVDSTGALVLQNLTLGAIDVKGYNTTLGITGNATNVTTLAAGSGGGISSVRQNLLNQFNGLLTQINQMAADAGFNGTNLLNGDSLKLNLNENGTSSVTIATSDSNGNAFAITYTNLGLATGTTAQFTDNAQLDTLNKTISTALTTLQTQSAAIASSLSVVQTRQSFTNAMINTLQTGANNLTVADSNAEGANLLALQTRQSLSTTALSLSAQSDRNVLRLFG
jgi:flagellin